MKFDYLTLAIALLFLIMSLLSTYKPNWVWGRLSPDLSEEKRARLIQRRKIGTVVYFALGAVFLVLSTR
jgi:hypothetical protein